MIMHRLLCTKVYRIHLTLQYCLENARILEFKLTKTASDSSILTGQGGLSLLAFACSCDRHLRLL